MVAHGCVTDAYECLHVRMHTGASGCLLGTRQELLGTRYEVHAYLHTHTYYILYVLCILYILDFLVGPMADASENFKVPCEKFKKRAAAYLLGCTWLPGCKACQVAGLPGCRMLVCQVVGCLFQLSSDIECVYIMFMIMLCICLCYGVLMLMFMGMFMCGALCCQCNLLQLPHASVQLGHPCMGHVHPHTRHAHMPFECTTIACHRCVCVVLGCPQAATLSQQQRFHLQQHKFHLQWHVSYL